MNQSVNIPNQSNDQGMSAYNQSMHGSINSGFGLTPKHLQDNIIRDAAFTGKKGWLRSPNTRTAPFGARNQSN